MSEKITSNRHSPTNQMDNYLTKTFFYDFDNNEIIDFVGTLNIQDHTSQKDKAIQLYQAIRDGWVYNPYVLHFKPEDCRASTIIRRSEGHCLDKSVLLITCLRALGIPSRLHLAKVKNHIAVEAMTSTFGTDELTPHGYVEIFLNQQWVSATPAFNKSLCEKIGVDVLDFDGETNSIFQQFNKRGDQFMEYIDDYGTFEDFPLEFIRENMIVHYPILKQVITDQQAYDVKTGSVIEN